MNTLDTLVFIADDVFPHCMQLFIELKKHYNNGRHTVFYYLLTNNLISNRSAANGFEMLIRLQMATGRNFNCANSYANTHPHDPSLTPWVRHDANQRGSRSQHSSMFEWKWSWAAAQQENWPLSVNSSWAAATFPLLAVHFSHSQPATFTHCTQLLCTPPFHPPPPLCCHSAVISGTLWHTVNLQPFTSANQDVDSSQPLRPIWKFPSQEASSARGQEGIVYRRAIKLSLITRY